MYIFSLDVHTEGSKGAATSVFREEGLRSLIQSTRLLEGEGVS